MSFAGKIVTLSNRLTSHFRERIHRHYTSKPFEHKHLKNLISLPSREDLLKQMPLNGVVAEIGVNEGDFSAKILSVTKPFKLILIDVWASKRYHSGLYEKVRNRFAQELLKGNIQIIRQLSFQGIGECADNFFDWVYLDTDHSYQTTINELELLRPKMKSGGIIAGHDYIIGNWNGGVRYGVIEAVREFCIQYNWEMIYLTHELDIPPSFAIRAMTQ